MHKILVRRIRKRVTIVGRKIGRLKRNHPILYRKKERKLKRISRQLDNF